jgi:hypothetical protein
MSKIIDIERLRFAFGDAWVAYKADDERDLSKVKQGVDGTKDADIVALLHGAKLYLMEVTDLRAARIQNRKKLLHGDMVREFVQKIRDTIPAIVGAFHTTGHKDQWIAFMKKLADRSEKIHVVLWMEQDAPRNLSEEKKRMAEMKTFAQDIKTHLRWLTPRVLVESLQTYEHNLPDLDVNNLPGAGQLSKRKSTA